MGRTKTQSSEDRLLKKRLAEKIRQEKIKKDPDRFLQEKFKRRLKYENKKKKGTVKPVNKMSLSEKREQRKKWQENSRRYRQNKKMIEELVPKTPSSDNEKKNDTNLAIASTLVPSNASTNYDRRMKMIEELIPKTPSSNNEKKNDANLAIACTLVPSNASTNYDGRMSNELGQRLINTSRTQT